MKASELNFAIKHIPQPKAVFKVISVPKWVHGIAQNEEVIYDPQSGGFFDRYQWLWDFGPQHLEFVGYR